MFSKTEYNDILSIIEKIKIDEESFRLADVEFNKNEESLIIHRVLMGEKEAFAEIVRAYQQMVFNLAYRYLGSHEEAEDLTQEVFIRVYRFLRRFKGESSLKTWIYRITVNSAYNRYDWLKRRKHKKQLSLDSGNTPDEKPLKEKIKIKDKNPESETLSREMQRKIQSSIESLPKRLRMAVILRDVEGLSYNEISEALQINEGTVKSRIARGRAALKELLKEYIEG
jgi:RNA polymerase sigma-70 factor (ECF subfamily)